MRIFLILSMILSTNKLLSDPFAYLTNVVSDLVSVIDLGTNTAVGYVNNNGFNIAHPIHILALPDGTKLYVVANVSNAVLILDPTQNKIAAAIDTNGFPFNNPRAMAVTPDGTKLYVTNQNSNQVSVIDTATATVTGYVNPGIYPFSFPSELAISPDGTKLYVANNTGNNVSIIDTATDTVTGYVMAGLNPFVGPFYVCYCKNTRAYVSDLTGNEISIIDATSDSVLGYVDDSLAPFSSPYSLFTNPPVTTCLVGNVGALNQVSVLDLSTDKVIQNITPGSFNLPAGMHITNDGLTAYVANAGDNSVSIVDMTSLAQTGFVDTSLYPLSYPFDFELSQHAVPGPQKPTSLQGIKTSDQFASQTDLINLIKWKEPLGQDSALFRIYRDAALTDLIGVVLDDTPYQFLDHNRKKNSVDTYYIVAVDTNGLASEPAEITVVR